MCLRPFLWLVSSTPTARSPSNRPRPSASSSEAPTRAHIPPTVRQPTPRSSARALRHVCGASQAAWSPKDEVGLLDAGRAHGTASALTPCSGHPARRVLHVAAGGPDVGRPPAPGGQGVVAVATPPAHRAPGRRPSRPCGNDHGVSPGPGALDDGGAQAEGGLERTLLHAAARLSPVVFSWSENRRYAGRAAAARCRLLPSGQPTQTPEEPKILYVTASRRFGSAPRRRSPTQRRDRSTAPDRGSSRSRGLDGWRRRRKFDLSLILGRGAYTTFRDVTQKSAYPISEVLSEVSFRVRELAELPIGAVGW